MKILITATLLFVSFFSFSQKIDTSYSKNKKRAIKMEFFSPLTGNTTFGYESYIKDWLSWEAKIGIIGLGVSAHDANYKGFLFKGGPKFKLNPDFITSDLRGSHLLSGKYIRPEIIFAQYQAEDEFFDSSSKSITSVALMITYGRQYVLANIMTLDYHIGLGYGYDSSEDGRYNFGHSNGNSDFPIAISAGFTIGVLLK
ncbi:MAG: DUF3575 domain-containing protein [Ekhidna sp.]